MDEFIEKFRQQMLDYEQEGINESTVFRDLDDWDSLTAMSVIAMMKDEYGVSIEPNEFRNMTTIADLYNFVQSKKNI